MLVGGLGLVLATPLLAVIMVCVQMVYIQDVLGDRESDISKKVDRETIEADARDLEREDKQ